MPEPPRSGPQRTADSRTRLDQDDDLWVATADPQTGTPYLIPLSFLWDDGSLVIATPTASPTGRNLLATGVVRLGVGHTRDVTLIEGTVRATPAAEIPAELGNAFAARTGFDPRSESKPYTYFRVYPHRVQAWREANELPGRELMREGRWLHQE